MKPASSRTLERCMAFTRRALSAALLVAAAPLILSARPPVAGGEARTFLISGMMMEGPDEPGTCKVVAESTLENFYKELSPEEKKLHPFDKLSALQQFMNQRLGFKRA